MKKFHLGVMGIISKPSFRSISRDKKKLPGKIDM